MDRTELRANTEMAIYNAMKPSTLEDTMKCAEIISNYRKKCENYDRMKLICDNEEELLCNALKRILKKAEALNSFLRSGMVDQITNRNYRVVIRELSENNPLKISFYDWETYMIDYGTAFLMRFPSAKMYLGKARKSFNLMHLKMELELFNEELIRYTNEIEVLLENIEHIKDILETEGEHTKLSITGRNWEYNNKILSPVVDYHAIMKYR